MRSLSLIIGMALGAGGAVGIDAMAAAGDMIYSVESKGSLTAGQVTTLDNLVEAIQPGIGWASVCISNTDVQGTRVVNYSLAGAKIAKAAGDLPKGKAVQVFVQE